MKSRDTKVDRRAHGTRECSFCKRRVFVAWTGQRLTGDCERYNVCRRCLPGFLKWVEETPGLVSLTEVDGRRRPRKPTVWPLTRPAAQPNRKLVHSDRNGVKCR